MIKINKEDFCKHVRKLEKYIEDMQKLNQLFSDIGDGYFSIYSVNDLGNSLIELLGSLTNSEVTDIYGNDIDYYLFESSRKVYIDDIEYDISTPEKLYDFLVIADDRNKSYKIISSPLVVGDKVYSNSGIFGIIEYTIDSILLENVDGKNYFTFTATAYDDKSGEQKDCLEFEPSDIGWKVFKTFDEAVKYMEEYTNDD